jgi:hypothetical protein
LFVSTSEKFEKRFLIISIRRTLLRQLHIPEKTPRPTNDNIKGIVFHVGTILPTGKFSRVFGGEKSELLRRTITKAILKRRTSNRKYSLAIREEIKRGNSVFVPGVE